MDIKSSFGGNRKGSGLDEILKNMFRYGKISSVNPARVSARVKFDDKLSQTGQPSVSHDLPIIVPGSLKNKHYNIPDISEDVVCLFLPNGIQRGFVLGSFYNVNNPPPVNSPDKEHVTFSDGTILEYDRSSHTLTVNVKGTVNVTATSGDVMVNGISLVHHVHGGVQSGGGQTGTPTG